MQDLCPLCLKNGVKRNIKLLQINLQEAVWMCEDEKCTWPFGYTGFVLSPRLVGKIWSCYWDDHKSTGKLKETALTSIQLPLSSPPTIPVKNVPIEYVTTSNLITNYTENINSLNPIEVKSSTDDSETSLHIKSGTLSFNNDKKEYKIEVTNNLDVTNNSLQLVNDKTENANINNELINVSDNKFERKKNYIQNNQDVSIVKEIPKIKNIEKTNIDLSKLKKNHVTAFKRIDEKLLHTNKYGNIKSKTCQPTYLSESEKSINSESFIKEDYNNEITEIKSNLNVTKVEIDGLPPITLSFEIPVCTTISQTVTANMEQNINEGIIIGNKKSNVPLIRRKVTSGKQYEKFSFSNIKKKLEINNSVDTNNKNNKISNNNVKSRNSDKISDGNENVTGSNTNCEQLASLTHDIYNCTSKRKNSVTTNNFPTQESILQDTSIANTSINIDTVLDDLLSNDYSVSENINDDWLNSLLI
ncbi:uncharacterized protein LOC116431208 [Nomia melanderi]|uniref:uncharacterized protein LOC116431208 n=1 Tax=Nomia melanderi TaxID=2448451 RepID=UPI003FCE0DCD